MSPRKLSDDDRQNIIELYRNSEETTSSLAIRYDVSNSTISRFLKSSLSESEYEDLIQQKRLARTSNSNLNSDQDEEQKDQEIEENLANDENQVKQVESNLENVSSSKKELPIIKLESSPPEEEPKEKEVILIESITEIMNDNADNIEEKVSSVEEDLETSKEKNTNQSAIYFDEEEDLEPLNIIGEMFGEDLSDDDDDDDEDEDDDEDDDDDEVSSEKISHDATIEILPISEASFPRICYVVIDHNSELITRPLKDFADLGDIPSEELEQETLPIFDNHRVAKRFSHRRGKIIKITDSSLFQKTATYLYQKGITRILIEGKIYCLS